MEELLCKLESQDTEESRKSVTRLQSMLRAERNPILLGELVEFYFATRSKRAVKVLSSLREAYSQVRPRYGTCGAEPVLSVLFRAQPSPSQLDCPLTLTLVQQYLIP